MAEQVLSATALDALRRLAFQDGDRVAVTSHLAHVRERATRDPLLEEARARLKAVEDAASAAARSRRAKEVDIQEHDVAIKRTEARLASGKLSSDREVSAAMTEIERTKQARDEAELAWIELSAEEERLAAALPEERAAFAVAEREAAARMAAAQRDLQAAEARLAEIESARRQAAQAIPAEVRERYRALFPRAAGRPFASVMAGQCSNCQTPLPGAVVQMVRAHAGVPNCPRCGRMLLEQ